MKLLFLFVMLLASLYAFSYAKHSWAIKNRSAAVGAILLAFASILLPIIVIF